MNDDAGFLHGEGGNEDDLDALVCVDGEGNVLHADDRVEEVLGYPRDEVTDSNLSRFVPDGHTEMVKEYVRSEGGDTDRDSVQVPAVTADDGETSLSVRFERRDVEGEQRQVGVVYDTEIKRTDAEEFFDRGFIEDILDTIDDVFFVLNEDLDLLFWNQSVNDVTGYSDDEIEEMDPLDFIPPEERDHIFDEIMRVVEEGHARAEGHYLTKGGERVPYEFSGTLLVDEDGNRLVCGTGRDISERKEHQEKLRNLHDATRSLMESETREEVVEESIRTLLEVLDLTVSGIWLYDAEDDVLRPADWSRGAEEIFDEIPVYESGNSLSWR
ncbi:MAG: PAS domain S-box protein, partial [Halobacteria archaeon]|nr:PAS domain S-box protein [Halobacteria archaeon]